MKNYFIPAVTVAAMVFATAAFAQPPVKIGNSAKGKVLTNESGMTLYTFAKDKNGKSACNDGCVKNWPPLLASAGAKPSGKYTIITRTGGEKQWAFKGKPLYTWKNDKKPGDISGNGLLHGAWHIAKP